MDAGSLPIWAQGAGAVAVVLISTITAIFKYLKTTPKATVPPAAEGAVVAASFVDSKLLKDLVNTLEDFNEEIMREGKKTQKSLQDVKDALNENTEASIIQTDTYGSLVKLLRSFMRMSAVRDNVQE